MNKLLYVCTTIIFIFLFGVHIHEQIKLSKYEYHIILTNDSVFVFNRYDKQIGKYKPTNPKEQFDSILLLDNL